MTDQTEEEMPCPRCGDDNPGIAHCLTCGARLNQGSDTHTEGATWGARLDEPEYVDAKRRQAVFAKLRTWGLVEASPSASTIGEPDVAESNSAGWHVRLGLLGGSLLAFLVVGWLVTLVTESFSVLDLLILLLAVFIHEMGHYIGMRHFGYTNLRMFFIPLFGAAVSGRSATVSTVEEAIVFLLGPVPGLLIGYACGILFIITRVALWRQFALVFVVLNGINLLPLYPLDGGQFLFTVLSGRSARVDTLLQVLLTLLLIGVGFSLGWGSFVGLGLSLAFRVRRLFKINQVVHELRASGATGTARQGRVIPLSAASLTIDMLRQRLPEMSDPKRVADNVVDVWRRANATRASLKEAASLLAAYGVGLFLFAVAHLAYLAEIAG